VSVLGVVRSAGSFTLFDTTIGLVVIDQVPAEVCSVCGDVLLRPETVRRIEQMLREARDPDRTAPVYEYVS